MKILWLVLAIIGCNRLLSAQVTEFPDTSGNAFVRLCSVIDKERPNAEENTHLMACVGWVDGYATGIDFGIAYAKDKTGRKIPGLFCYPETVENGQLIRVLLKYIRDNPERAHQSTSVLLVTALSKAYPCK